MTDDVLCTFHLSVQLFTNQNLCDFQSEVVYSVVYLMLLKHVHKGKGHFALLKPLQGKFLWKWTKFCVVKILKPILTSGATFTNMV